MQTSYSQNPAAFYEGMPVDSGPKDDASTIVEETNGIDPGLLVFRGTDRARQATLPPATAADADAIVATFATSASQQVLDDAGELDGVIGLGRISPPSKLDFIFSNHADWDATTITLVGRDQDGVEITESVSVPNGGNATVTTTNYFSFVESITVPAQSGTSGSMTVGTKGPADRTLDGADVIGVSLLTQKARSTFVAADNETYEDEERMPVRKEGRIAVACETAFEAGQRPLVRLAATGAERLGAFRATDDDGGDCVRWNRARFITSGTAGAIGVLEVRKD